MSDNIALIDSAISIASVFENDSDDNKLESLLEHIEKTANSIVFDINTEEGKKTCRQLAYKIAQTKKVIDDAGKQVKDKYTVHTRVIDSNRRLSKQRLEALQTAIRQPLTDIENAEKQRVADLQSKLDNSFNMRTSYANSDSAQAHFIELSSIDVNSDWQEFEEKAKIKKADVIIKLSSLVATMQKQEKAKAEAETRIKEKQKAEAEAEKQRIREQAEAEAEARLQAEKEALVLKEKELAQAKKKAEAEVKEAKKKAEAEVKEAKKKAEAEFKEAREKKVALAPKNTQQKSQLAQEELMKKGIDSLNAYKVVKLISAGLVHITYTELV